MYQIRPWRNHDLYSLAMSNQYLSLVSQKAPWIVGSIALLYALDIYLNYRRVLRSVNNHPGIRTLLSVDGIISSILPPIPRIVIGRHWAMRLKHAIYAEKGWDVITGVCLYPRPSARVLVADPLAIKEITTNRSRFPKSIKDYGVLSFYGKNIVVTEGEEWKQHRKVAAPVFSERNNKLVWDESIRVIFDMIENWGPNNPEVVINHASDITIPIALLIISVAGFGRRISWKEDKDIPAGHTLSFKDAVHTVSTYVHVKLLVPKWAYPFSKFLRHVQLAFDELENYMQEMIDARKSSVVKEERHDLFNALLDASEADKDDAKLTDRELIGNIFIFLIAGHETTAHTLSFCLGLLALEQEEQEKLYQHIISVLPNGEIPRYEHMSLLTHSLAAFYETLRLYPPVGNIPKVSAEDTTIPAVRPDGTKGVVFVPKDTRVVLNTTGLHYNPRYWPDPEAFKPSRFLGDWPRDAFLPFSGGPRACVGRKFSETEAVAIITLLVSRYKIDLRNPELYEGLTHSQKRAKLLANRQGITVTPLSVPIVLRKR